MVNVSTLLEILGPGFTASNTAPGAGVVSTLLEILVRKTLAKMPPERRIGFNPS